MLNFQNCSFFCLVRSLDLIIKCVVYEIPFQICFTPSSVKNLEEDNFYIQITS